jgi:hypothetical protein
MLPALAYTAPSWQHACRRWRARGHRSLPLSDRIAEFEIWLAPGTYDVAAADEQRHREHGRLECHADGNEKLRLILPRRR